MSTENLSYKTRIYTSQRFKDSFVNDIDKHTGFIFIGKPQEYAVANTIDTIQDNLVDEKIVWENMIAAKKISPGDVEIVIPRYNWTANTTYKQFDDTVEISSLITSNSENPMYVRNSEGNVYMCLRNNLDSESTTEPTGDYNSANGVIRTSDDYIWKYMYTVRDSSKFLDDDWMPVPGTTYRSLNSTEFGLDPSNLVDGGLYNIVVTNSGNNYIHTTTTVGTFTTAQTYLGVTSTANLAANMLVQGTGILPGTYITSVSEELNRVNLSEVTTGSGGGAANSISFLTRVVLDGDGTGALTTVVLTDNNGIEDIKVTSDGIGYTRANVIIYGSGTGAEARAILPIKFGHGYSPMYELGAKDVMVVKRIGDVDATENGTISTTTSFRQYGLLLDPHKYGENEDVKYANSNTVMSQTTDLTLLSGSDYDLDEFVYQGTESEPNFQGYLNAQDSGNNIIKLTNVIGTIDIGALITGANSGISRPVVSIKTPDLEPYTGDILYVTNVAKVERAVGQSEEIKFVIKF